LVLGVPDGVQRWGENDVASITNLGVGVGDMLRVVFDGNGGSNECTSPMAIPAAACSFRTMAFGNSRDQPRRDGEFSNDVDNTAFTAALTDRRELFQQDGPSDWILIDDAQPLPSGLLQHPHFGES